MMTKAKIKEYQHKRSDGFVEKKLIAYIDVTNNYKGTIDLDTMGTVRYTTKGENHGNYKNCAVDFVGGFQ